MSKASDTDFRRKWDVEEYKEKERVREREKEDKERPQKPVERDLLRQRDFKVDLDSKLGKTQVVTKDTAASQSGGYYCDVCDCVLKDSTNFLDHINGKKHQRNMGMSMKVKRSTADEVRDRFAHIKKRKLEAERAEEFDFEKRVAAAKAEEERLKKKRRAREKEKKEEKAAKLGGAGNQLTAEEEMMRKMMGFGSFDSSKS
eukprot:CFRG7799T1